MNARLWRVFKRWTDLLKRYHVVQDLQASNQKCTADKFKFKFHTLLSSVFLFQDTNTHPWLCALVFFLKWSQLFLPHVEHRLQNLIKYGSQFMCQSKYSNEALFDWYKYSIETIIRFETRMHTDGHSKLIIYKLFIYFEYSQRRQTHVLRTFTCKMMH